jgi:hypothetical protein
MLGSLGVLVQFGGSKGVALFVTIIGIVCAVGFGSGLLVGRHFPVHHFQKMESSHYLYDTSTGYVCDFFPSQLSDMTLANPIDAPKTIPHCDQMK